MSLNGDTDRTSAEDTDVAGTDTDAGGATAWFMPAEDGPHTRCWMAFPARTDIWGRQLDKVRAAIARVANAVVDFEPVMMCVQPGQESIARALLSGSVEILSLPVDDFWMRDTGPCFITDGRGGLAGVDLGFNGWGQDQVHGRDALVAKAVLDHLGLRRVRAELVSEGGAIELDGDGTAMLTESSVIDPRRNPGKSKADIEGALKVLGVRKVLWVPGVQGRDITDDHIDTTARFVAPGRIVIELPKVPDPTYVWDKAALEAQRLLTGAKDARGRALEVTIVRQPETWRSSAAAFVPSYINWYVANGAVITAQFGDVAADAAAKAQIEALFPGRTVVQVEIDAIAAGGGGIHCSTQQEPRVG